MASTKNRIDPEAISDFSDTADEDIPVNLAADAAPSTDGLHPIRFDPGRRCKSTKLRQDIARLRDRLVAYEIETGKRKRARKAADQRKFETALEAIAANLLVVAMVAPGRPLAVPRSHGVMWGGWHEPAHVYGQHFLDILDAMEALDLIKRLQKGFRINARTMQPTLIGPGAQLPSYMPLARTSWDDFTREAWANVLILKAPKVAKQERADVMPYTDTARTKAVRRPVEALNKRLTTCDLSVELHLLERPVSKEGIIVDPTSRQVRRIFNNASWQQGGRLYGAFWETMWKEDRWAALRIQGEPIGEIDFRQLFPHLAYVKAGLVPPEGDLYDIEGDELNRTGWKRLMNAMLFIDHELKQWPRDCADQFDPPITLKTALASIKARHPALVPMFGRAVGFELMRIESDVLMLALPRLFAQDIVALPLHDAVLTARSKVEQARSILAAAYCERTGESDAPLEVNIQAKSKSYACNNAYASPITESGALGLPLGCLSPGGG